MRDFYQIKQGDNWQEAAPVAGQLCRLVTELDDGSQGYAEFIYQQPEAAKPIRIITVGAFRRRYTLAERVAIESSADPVVKVLNTDLALSEFANLDFSETIEGIDYLISTGIIAAERRAALLADGTKEESI